VNRSTRFEHQDWLGTERLRTTYNGAVEGSYTSLPFGDAYAASGSDADPYHYAQLDYDSETNSDHAQFRQYSSTQGRWMRPDPYYGSYDYSNPQSFNRYAYIAGNPLSGADPSGLECDLFAGCGVECANDPVCAAESGSGGGYGGYGADTDWGGGLNWQQQELLLYGQQYGDLPGGSAFGVSGMLSEWAYSNLVSLGESGEGAGGDPVAGATIWVFCSGFSLDDYQCLPAPYSLSYFAPDTTFYYSNPDNQRIRVLAGAVVFDVEHPFGGDLQSSCAGTASFLGDTAVALGVPGGVGTLELRGGTILTTQAASELKMGAVLGTGGGVAIGIGGYVCNYAFATPNP